MEFQCLGFCQGCIEAVLESEIEFTEPTCLTEVGIEECANYTLASEYLTKERYEGRITRVALNNSAVNGG